MNENMINAEEYINNLKEMYRSYFDLKENTEIADKKFDLYAFSHIKNEKYFATESLKIWEYAKYEHCLINKINTSESNLLPDKNFLKNAVDEVIELHRNHKQSYLTLIKISENGIDQDQVENIQNFSYSKSFYFGFRGWLDLRLIVVDLKNNKVYTNEEGNKVKNNYKIQRFIKEKSS